MNDPGSVQAQHWAAVRQSALHALGGGSPSDVLRRLLIEKPAVMTTVLGHLQQRLSDDEIVAWLTCPDTWSCRGRKPVDLLALDPEAVVEAARHLVASTWD